MAFEDVLGNSEIKEYLLKNGKTNHILQSYLFVGIEGIGKLLMAKAFAKMILCLEEEKKEDCECKACKCFEGQNHPDFQILNETGDTIKVEQIRELVSKVLEPPIISQKKVYIINDCEKMTLEAQNCLLKTLEEPPEFAVIILISSREYLILNTIKSRCMTLKFQNISEEELKKYVVENLGYNKLTGDIVELFEGSIAQAIQVIQRQEIIEKIREIVDDFETKDIVYIMKEAKVLYDKEYINDYLEYLMLFIYKKAMNNRKYIDCIEKVKHCQEVLKRNCNFDMCVDTLLFDIHENFQK